MTAQTDGCPCAAFADAKRRLYGVQFHPEVTHTAFGQQMLHNFLYAVCGCQGLWSAEDFAAAAIERCRGLLAGKKVLLALSGALFFVFLCMCFAGAPNFSLGLFAVFVLSVGLSETKGEIFSKQIVFEVYKKRLDRGVEKKTLVFSEETTLKSVAKRMSHHFVYRIEVVEAKDGEVKKVFSHAQFLNLLSSHALDTPLKELL